MLKLIVSNVYNKTVQYICQFQNFQFQNALQKVNHTFFYKQNLYKYI